MSESLFGYSVALAKRSKQLAETHEDGAGQYPRWDLTATSWNKWPLEKLRL
jgi:hypothetical protein